MPNGYYGSIEDWQRMEAPLLDIDDLLEKLAEERNLEVVRNYHNWPSRHLEWVTDGIYRGVQILAADKPQAYHMGVVAWEDKNDQRHQRTAMAQRRIRAHSWWVE